MLNLNPIIEKSTSGTLPGVYRYTYVLNNPLKYTDPSGYKYEFDWDAWRAAHVAEPGGSSGGGGNYNWGMAALNALTSQFISVQQRAGIIGYNYSNGTYYKDGVPVPEQEARMDAIYPNSLLTITYLKAGYYMEDENTAWASFYYEGSLGQGPGYSTNSGIDPYQKSHGLPVYTLEKFLSTNQGKSYWSIINQELPKDGLPGGPSMRMVLNPSDGRIMDMRHVMVVGFGSTLIYRGNPIMGNVLGFGVEVVQWIGPIFGKDSRASAFDRQDFYSNNVGAKFGFHFLYTGKFRNDWSESFYNWLNK